MAHTIRKRLGEFYIYAAFPMDGTGATEPMPLKNLVDYLLAMQTEYEEKGYSNVTCEITSHGRMIVRGERPETEEEEIKRLAKAQAREEKAAAKKQARIKKLEAELKRLKDD